MGKKKFWRELEGEMVKMARRLGEAVSTIPEKCKLCSSKRVVRYGHYHGVQRWWCKDCRRKFVHDDALPRMKTPIVQVTSALSMFYEGMSLHGTRRNLEQTYRNYPSNSTIYEWIIRFTKQAIASAKDYKPNVGDEWSPVKLHAFGQHQLPGFQRQPPLESEISAPPNTFLFSRLFPSVVILQESRISSGPIFEGRSR